MTFKSSEFIASVGTGGNFLRDQRPEYLIVGRSNVGKSSLINVMAGKKDLARVSKVPGKTRAVNYFLINRKFYLVDLPGYGYARLSKKERAEFARLLDSYLETPHNNRLALLLADGRHDPMPQDLDAAAWLRSRGLEYRLILTKTDAVKGALAARLKLMAAAFDLPLSSLYPTSAITRNGAESLCHDLQTSLLMTK
jgi:GTP-binding protein